MRCPDPLEYLQKEISLPGQFEVVCLGNFEKYEYWQKQFHNVRGKGIHVCMHRAYLTESLGSIASRYDLSFASLSNTDATEGTSCCVVPSLPPSGECDFCASCHMTSIS